jgi:DNA-binding MarR family transcriptional regulator
MSVNEIIDQTSSDRTFVIKAIKKLQKCQFIENTKSESHKQKKINKLTELGQELANIMTNIHKFNAESYRLSQLIDEYRKLDEEFEKFKEIEVKDKPLQFTKRTPIEIIPKKYKNSEKILKRKLQNKGWTNEEIEYYCECQQGLYYTNMFLHEGVIKIVIYKFLSIIDNFNLNDDARELINIITIQIFQSQLSDIVTNIHGRYTKYLKDEKKDKNDNDKIDYSRYYPNFKFDPLDYIDKLRFPFSSSIIKIVKKVMLSYLNLLNLQTDIIDSKLKSIRLDIEDSPLYAINDNERSRDDMMIGCRCLIMVYEKYVNSN